MTVVLASASPQRREILERLGIEFEVRASGVEESSEGDPAALVVENALRKATAVADRVAGAGPAGGEGSGVLVIGCDTDVVLDGRMIGKPADEAQARRHLQMLSGRSHEVLSGLALVGPRGDQRRTGLARSVVAFRRLGEDLLDRYLASGEWRDRAGGYAVQARGSTLIAAIEGDVSNVIGLPVGLLLELAPELA